MWWQSQDVFLQSSAKNCEENNYSALLCGVVVVRDSKKIRLEQQSGLATDSALIARDAGKRGSFLLQWNAI